MHGPGVADARFHSPPNVPSDQLADDIEPRCLGTAPADAHRATWQFGLRQTNTVTTRSRSSRQVIVIGDYLARVFALTLTQPADSFDDELLADLMAGVFLDPQGPGYAQGVPIPHVDDQLGWMVEIPDNWFGTEQPKMADGSPATGVRRFNGSWLMVSLGDSDGDLRLCDETCREVSGLDSLEELRVAVASWLPAATPDTVNETGGLLIADTVGGFLHREMQGEEDLRTRYSSPSGSMIVAPSSWHSMCRAGSSRWTRSSRSPGRSNSRIRRRPATPRSTLRIGSFEVTLEGGRWRIGEGPDPSALYLRRGSTEVLIRSGDEEGRVKTCHSPAPGGWEHCDPVRATSLDLLDVERRACPPLPSTAPFPARGRRHPR